MQPIFRILRKDLYHYRWAWVFFLFTSLIKILLHGTSLGWISPNFYDAWKPLIETLPWLMGFVLVVLAVQDETLGTPDAYWTSRPVRRLYTLVAKLLFCGIVLCGICVLSDAIILILNKGAHRLPWFLLNVLTTTAWLWAVILLAAQTRSLARFALILFGIAIGCLLLPALLLSIIILGGWEDSPVPYPGILIYNTDPGILAITQALLWTISGAFLLVYFYKSQKRSVWYYAIPTIACSIVLTPSDHGKFGTEADNVTLSLPTLMTLNDESLIAKKDTYPSNPNTYRFIAQADNLSGKPIPSISPTDHLWITNKRVKIHEPSLEFSVPNESGIEESILTVDDDGYSSFPVVLLETTASNLQKQGNQALMISGQFNLRCYDASSPIAILPLKEKETFPHDGNRIGIDSVVSDYNNSDRYLTLRISYQMIPIRVQKETMNQINGCTLLRNYVFEACDPSSGQRYQFGTDPNTYYPNGWIEQKTRIPSDINIDRLDLLVYVRRFPDWDVHFFMEEDVNLRQVAGLPPAGSSTE